MGAGEALDIYVDDMEKLGECVGLGPGDLYFRLQFYEGLPLALHEWAVSMENVYSGDFPSSWPIFGTGWR